ncbi:MAG: SUMF1/EgtB/PvdO family nonheme iron enzyme [Opitutales bacterium]|nr:SUMF1/EgtB/PvdO family nonheme iron enzyme [Opitutales bacterium]
MSGTSKNRDLKSGAGRKLPPEFTYVSERNHALIVVIDAYQHWPSLRCAVRDGETFAKVLVEDYRFPQNQVRLLRNEEATRAGILRALHAYFQLGDEDNLVIFFALHGDHDPLSGNGYIVPQDAARGDDAYVDFLHNSLLKGSYFESYKVRHLLVISDSCYSASLLRSARPPARAKGWNPARGYGKPSRWVIASGDAPVPDDGGAGHSPFMTRMLQYLRFGDEDCFGVLDLHTHLRRSLPQEPMVDHLHCLAHVNGGEFVFVRPAGAPEVLGTPAPSAPPPPAETQWHVHIDGRREILAGSLIEARLGAGDLPPSALVWKPGMAAWAPLETLPELAAFLLPPPVPEPKPIGPRAGRDWTVPELGLELVWIEPGSFLMGSPESEEDRTSDEALHTVRLTKGFWLGKYAVTQGEYEAVTGEDPSASEGSDRLPVEYVSWDDAEAFCEELNGKYGEQLPPGYRFRLPTEAQWEYACRAGTQTPFAFGQSLDSSQANFDGDYPYGGAAMGPNRGKTTPVGSFAPNAWGLYDMHGNVWEWCADWFGDYRGDDIDPAGRNTGSYRVSRGGSWDCYARFCRCAFRYLYSPDNRDNYLGFRLALSCNP